VKKALLVIKDTGFSPFGRRFPLIGRQSALPSFFGHYRHVPFRIAASFPEGVDEARFRPLFSNTTAIS